jgi:hypothetical protein
MLMGPLLLGVLARHRDQLRGVHELLPATIACLALFGIVRGVKRAWRIHRIEADEEVRERVRRRMRGRNF